MAHGEPLNSVMPAQAGALSAPEVEAVLNYVSGSINKLPPGFKPYRAAEVAQVRGSAPTLLATRRLHQQSKPK